MRDQTGTVGSRASGASSLFEKFMRERAVNDNEIFRVPKKIDDASD